jgi:hypothetical protein
MSTSHHSSRTASSFVHFTFLRLINSFSILPFAPIISNLFYPTNKTTTINAMVSHTPSPSPSPPLTATNTITTPPPQPTITFYWICLRSSCHTCLLHSRSSQPLSPSYFHDYSDTQQLAQEWEIEELNATALHRCMRGCRARQVYVCTEPTVASDITSKSEWSYVNAKCGVCGRVAGRSAFLVNIERS